MRISDSAFHGQTLRSIATARSRLFRAQAQASTGKRVEKPSDDPLASALSRRETGRIARADNHLRAVSAAKLQLESSEVALESASELLMRAQEITIQGASESLSADQRAILGLELGRIRAQVVALGNSEVGGKYIFAGFRDDVPAFDATGAWQGDGNIRELEVAPGVRVASGVSGDAVFGAAGGVDVMAALTTLETALNANDVAGVQASLSTIDSSVRQVAAARADIGAKLGAVHVAGSVAERTRYGAVTLRSDLVDADVFDVLSELTNAEGALQAAVEVGRRLPPAGLLGGG